MAAIGHSTGTALLAGRRALQQPAAVRIATSNISALRVRPFCAPKPANRLPSLVVRSAEPDAPAPAAESEVKPATEEEDFDFSYSGAKKNNEYTSSDVEAALALYYDGEGQESDYERDHIGNNTGGEDASFFDDIDNVEGYEDDEYATAGIAEAAPKTKRRDRNGPGADKEEEDTLEKAKDVGASQALEDAAIMRAQMEEMDPENAEDKDQLDMQKVERAGDTGVWSWLADFEGMSDVPADDLAMTHTKQMAAVPTEGEVFASLAKGIAGGEELDAFTREYLDFVADDVALGQELERLDGEEEDLPESTDDSDDAAAEARIQELLEMDLDVSDLSFDPALLEDEEDDEQSPLLRGAADAGLDEESFQAYLEQLRTMPVDGDDGEANGEEEELDAKMMALMADDEGVAPQEEEIADDGMDSEQAAVEALLARVPAAASGAAAAADMELVATFASGDDVDEGAVDADEADTYSRELSAMMTEEVGWTEETYPTAEALDVYSSYVNLAESYLAEEDIRREELAAAVARGELPVEMLEEELADPVDNEEELYESVIEAAEEVEGMDYTGEDMEDDDNIDWQERIIELKRVTKVTKGGKVMGFRCTAVVGNLAGLVGVGCDSGREVGIAVKRALVDAKKNIIIVPLVGPGTIPHRAEARFKAASCVLRPASDGTGVIAGGAVRSVLELAGVQNVLAKRLGCRTLLTNARATIKALSMLKTLGEVSEYRGIPYEELLVARRK